jgi:hypothetical protein
MRWRALPVAGFGLAFSVLVACGGGQTKTDATSVKLPNGAIPVGADAGLADPPPTLLAEPVLTGNAKLFARTVQINSLCTGLPQLQQINQPRADDLDAQIDYAGIYYNTLTTIDPDRYIVDRQASSRTSQKRPLPATVKAALATERTEMYAYIVRLTYARDLRDQGKNTAAQTRARMQAAFRTLAFGPYADADLLLVRYEVDHCA